MAFVLWWPAMLHVTSGDAAADSLRRAGIDGIVLAWHDVLHEGPVRMGLAPEALRSERAAFLATLSDGDPARIERLLAHRDEVLDNFDLHEEVVLWFEADLFDQLQLLQVLDRFASTEIGAIGLSLVDPAPTDPGPQRPPGLAQLDTFSVARLFAKRSPVSDEQIELSTFAWQAFRAPDPVFLERLCGMDMSVLAHLGAALHRHLEQFPSVRHGLGRTERAILAALADGPCSEAELFRRQAEQEERPFLGGRVFRWYLARLANGANPAIIIDAADDSGDVRVRRTEAGGRYAEGVADFVHENGIDRWWGGVHQHGNAIRWRWEPDSASLRSAEKSGG